MKHFRRRDKSAAQAKGAAAPAPHRGGAGNARNAENRANVVREEGGHRCKTCNMVPVAQPHSKCVQCRTLDGI